VALLISRVRKENRNQRWKPTLVWRVKAYTTVFGIMVLTFTSLGFLYIYELGSELLAAIKKGRAENQEWESLQSK
jgi:hypothetical protein